MTDDNGVGEVTINGAVATPTAGVYVLNATGLKIGANVFTIVAKDVAGKQATNQVTITRAWKDTIAPVVDRQTGTGPKSVDNAVSTTTVSWSVADTLLDKVTIQGVARTSTTNVYTVSIGLVVGSNKVALVATDKQGNATTDEFIVVRNAPAPVHGAAAGNYIGTLYDTIKATGADSIQYSIDGIDWRRAVNGVAAVKSSGTFDIHAKSWPGEVVTKLRVTIRQVKTVKTRGENSFFLMEDGTVWGAGTNYSGQLGDNSTTASPSAKQLMTDVADVAAGADHTLFLKTDGTVWGTGSENYYGELCAVPGGAPVLQPKLIAGGYKAIAAGTTTTFLQRSTDGRWYSCGANGSGELGTGYVSETQSYLSPIALTEPVTVVPGHMFTLFLKPDGSVWGSGNNGYGPMPIPDGTSPDDQVPSLRYGGAIGAAAYGHSLLINRDGTVSTFGGNSRLGGTDGINTATAVAAGQTTSVFLLSDGSVYISGELSPFERAIVPIKLMDGGATITAGSETVFVVKTDGTLWGYGSNASGSFGIGEAGKGGYTAPYRINF